MSRSTLRYLDRVDNDARPHSALGSLGLCSDFLWGGGGADVYRFEAADLVAGDLDTVLMGFGEGDLLSFAASLNGQVSAIAGTSAGVSGVYLTAAVTGGTWFAWLPYQTVASVEAAIVYG